MTTPLRTVMTHRRGITRCAGAVMLALVATACGSSSTDTVDTTAVDTVDTTVDTATPETTTVDTATPDTTTVDTSTPDTATPDTTAPDTTAPTSDASVTVAVGADWSEWLVVRKVIRDNGFWGVPTDGVRPVEARTYWMRCDDDPCTKPTFESRSMSETASNGTQLTAEVQGTVLTYGDSSAVECTDPSTGQPTGPLEATMTQGWTLDALDPSGSSWAGSYERVISSAGSDSCTEENIGYTASMVLFDPTAVEVTDEVTGIWLGESEASPGVEQGVRSCEPDEGCDVMVRTARDDAGGGVPGGPGVTRAFHDIPMTQQSDGSYYGTADYPTSCNSDLDSSYVSAAGYVTTHQVWLTVYDLGEGAQDRYVAEFDSAISGATHPDLSAEQAAVCTPFEKPAGRLLALLNDTPAVIDWERPEGESFPIPS